MLLCLLNCEDLDRYVTDTVGTVIIVGTKKCPHNFLTGDMGFTYLSFGSESWVFKSRCGLFTHLVVYAVSVMG